MIGQEHIRRLDGGPGGSRVVAVADADAERAATVAGRLPAAKALPGGEELIASDAVDAVVVTSWGPTGGRPPGGPPPGGFRAARPPRRKAGVLREAAGHHAGRLPPDRRRRGR